VNVFAIEGWLMLVVFFVLLAVKIYAFGSSLTFSAETYHAAGKLTKTAWCMILGLGVALQVLVSPINFLSIGFTIAAFVYLVDVRPALAGLRRR
jgi:hypothetical protein